MNKEQNLIKTAADHRLSALSGNPFLAQRIIAAEKGEQEVKKASISLALILVLMILTLSVGFALVSSGILENLYGSGENAPQAVMQQIQTPEETVNTKTGKVKVDEILYDGTALHTTVTIENPTGKTLLYTLDGLRLNGMYIMGSNILTDGAGYGGMLLGGSTEGTPLPASYTFYNKGECLQRYDENGKFMGYTAFPEGTATLTVEVAVWQPINAPALIDYRDYEGFDTAETRKNLVADVNGLCDLELFRPEKYRCNTTGKDVSSDIYADVYKELGWAEKIDAFTLSIPVTLSKNAVPHATPAQMEYEMNGMKIIFTSFDFTQAGGEATGKLQGDYNTVSNFLRSGVQLVDRATDRVFTGGLIWNSDGKDGKAVDFTLRLMPFTGEMPAQVQLVPTIAYDDRWVETSPAYDPSVIKPDNAVDCWLLDFDRAITLELIQN